MHHLPLHNLPNNELGMVLAYDGYVMYMYNVTTVATYSSLVDMIITVRELILSPKKIMTHYRFTTTTCVTNSVGPK